MIWKHASRFRMQAQYALHSLLFWIILKYDIPVDTDFKQDAKQSVYLYKCDDNEVKN